MLKRLGLTEPLEDAIPDLRMLYEYSCLYLPDKAMDVVAKRIHIPAWYFRRAQMDTQLSYYRMGEGLPRRFLRNTVEAMKEPVYLDALELPFVLSMKDRVFSLRGGRSYLIIHNVVPPSKALTVQGFSEDEIIARMFGLWEKLTTWKLMPEKPSPFDYTTSSRLADSPALLTSDPVVEAFAKFHQVPCKRLSPTLAYGRDVG